MRIKFISAVIATVFFSWFIFLGCHKTDQNLNPEQRNEVASFKKEAQKWWDNNFVKSAAYGLTDWSSPLAPPSGSSTKKYPVWRRVAAYSLGKYQVVEMPLLYETNTILLPGMQKLENTAEGMRIAASAIQRLLLFKKPNGSIAVRTVTIVPTPEYAKKMNYDLSHISMKKLPDDFSGYQMIAGWDGSKKNIVRYEAGKKPRTVKILTGEAYRARKAASSAQAHQVCDWVWIPEYIWVCVYSPLTLMGEGGGGDDGGGGPDPNDDPCYLYGHWEEHGGHYVYVCVEVPDDPDPDPNPDPFQECLNNGGTNEQCNCQLYGICDDDPEPCEATQAERQEFNHYVIMAPLQDGEIDASATNEGPDPIVGGNKWRLGGGLFGSWHLVADYDYKYYHHAYMTPDLQKIDEYDLFYFHSGEPYITGSNLVINSTYSATSPVSTTVINNNTKDCYGEAYYRGIILHESLKVKNQYCEVTLRWNSDVNVKMRLHPR